METVNFNTDFYLLTILCEKFSLFPNKEINYTVNKYSESNYLNFSINHVKGAKAYTEITEFSQNICLVVDGEFKVFIHWLIGVILPGLWQPAMPGVDIVDILYLLKGSSKSTQEFVDDLPLPGFPFDTDEVTGALFIFHDPFSSSTTDAFDDAWIKERCHFNALDNQDELLFILAAPTCLAMQEGEYLEILKDFYPSNVAKQTQRILFYK